MDFATAVKTVVMEKYAKFDGRASRSEYWWFTLAYVIAYLVLAMVDYILGIRLLTAILSLGLLLPSIGVAVRRLHDIGKSGWWLLLIFAIIIGWIVLIYWYVQPSEGENQYGPTPVA